MFLPTRTRWPSHPIACVVIGCFWLTLAAHPVQAAEHPAVPEEEVNTVTCPSWQTQYEQLTNPAFADQVLTARHRGFYNEVVPENSMGAFARSLNACHSSIETDVRLTKDNQLVAFHDTHIGKMLEPTYNPETKTGPNPRLKDLTYDEILKKHLVLRDRGVTHYTMPLISEVLEFLVAKDGQSLMHLEVKDKEALAPTARLVADLAEKYPDSELNKRVVIKFAMDFSPSPEHWDAMLHEQGITMPLLAYPYMTPPAAEAIDTGDVIPDVPGIELSTNSSRAVAQWAVAEPTLAPAIEVVVKDSSEFYETQQRTHSPFGKYDAPTSVGLDDVKDGSVAEFAAIAKHFGKRLGSFVPVPDYIQYLAGPEAGYTVPNSFGTGKPAIEVTKAFNFGSSECCYRLDDRRTSSRYAAELHDWRMNLDFQRALGVTMYTADDTDTIELHARDHHELDTIARPNPVPPLPGMRSLLFTHYQGKKEPDTALVQIKGWDGGYSGEWGGQVCLWTYPGQWVWAAACNLKATGYSPNLEIHTPGDGTMVIRDPRTNQCISSKSGYDDRVAWSTDCESADAHWIRTPEHRFRDAHGRDLTFAWDDRYFEGRPYAYNYPARGDKSTWSVWRLDPPRSDSSGDAEHPDGPADKEINPREETPSPPENGGRPGDGLEDPPVHL